MQQTRVLADFPGLLVMSNFKGNELLELRPKAGYEDIKLRTTATSICIKSFPRDNHEWIRQFTIGHDVESGYWTYSNASMISDSHQERTVAFGFELNDEIVLDGKTFKIVQAPNQNIALEEVTT